MPRISADGSALGSSAKSRISSNFKLRDWEKQLRVSARLPTFSRKAVMMEFALQSMVLTLGVSRYPPTWFRERSYGSARATTRSPSPSHLQNLTVICQQVSGLEPLSVFAPSINWDDGSSLRCCLRFFMATWSSSIHLAIRTV